MSNLTWFILGVAFVVCACAFIALLMQEHKESKALRKETDAQVAERIIAEELSKHSVDMRSNGGPMGGIMVCRPGQAPVVRKATQDDLDRLQRTNERQFTARKGLTLKPGDLRKALDEVHARDRVADIARLNVGNAEVLLSPRAEERMYADSGHQVVNPEVMKRVLNEQFGDLDNDAPRRKLIEEELELIVAVLKGYPNSIARSDAQRAVSSIRYQIERINLVK